MSTKPKDKDARPPLRVLADTCVWLDIAKDYRQKTLISALEELVRIGEVELIVPQVVREEFARNKARVAEESARGLSSVMKRVREAVDQFGADDKKAAVLAQLNDIDHRAGTLGEAVNGSIERIEALLEKGVIVKTTGTIKVRAADRAIAKQAPFHRQRNGIDDAIIIETYADAVAKRKVEGSRIVFVTHNTKDFSDPSGDNRNPHPDLAPLFTGKSAYAISLGEVLNKLEPDLLEDFKFELEWAEEPRRLSEILSAMDELFDKVWYNRHWNTRIAIEEGRTKIVEKETFPVKDHATRPIQHDVWEGALKAAKRVEKKHGKKNLGPWSDFEWGMINGKLSALRWVLGDEWDMLDT
ncbi:MAG: PIN domain-containing protein [Hyphomicrobiaceae bacterium]|uniref:PIN domain-containing protein n=1 Tax=Pseudorhodoplanes sp. TaxID=1934341 RepID=UPI003D0EB788